MTLARPRVDVGIVSWNTRELTLAAVSRLLDGSQSGVDVRVLVRDNGSSDGTPEAVRAQFPGVLLEVGDNVGFARGVNALLRMSDAPWFMTLNSDAWTERDALRTLVELAEQQPRAFAVAPLLLRPDGQLEHSTHPFPSPRVAALSGFGGRFLRGDRARELCLPPAWGHDAVRQVDWAVGAALLVRRAAMEEIGDLDETFFMYAEDLEWCWRADRAGWETWFTPHAVVWHVGNASGTQRFGGSRERVAIQNATIVVRRYLGPRRAAVWGVLNAAGAVRQAVKASRRGDRGLASFWLRQLPGHLGRGGVR